MKEDTADFKPERIYRSPILTNKDGERVIVEIQQGPMSFESHYDAENKKQHIRVTMPVRHVTHKVD